MTGNGNVTIMKWRSSAILIKIIWTIGNDIAGRKYYKRKKNDMNCGHCNRKDNNSHSQFYAGKQFGVFFLHCIQIRFFALVFLLFVCVCASLLFYLIQIMMPILLLCIEDDKLEFMWRLPLITMPTDHWVLILYCKSQTHLSAGFFDTQD